VVVMGFNHRVLQSGLPIGFLALLANGLRRG
jgi:hypothetical protein